ncbi:MAG: sulfotransferase [Steroidobacterales bacterium]
MVASSSSPGREAMQLLQAGRHAEALPIIERAVAGATVCLPAHGLLAIILSRLKRRRDADAIIEAAMKLKAGVADAYDALAFASMGLGRHERASELYRRAAELAPGTSRFWYNLAACERGLGRLQEAEAASDRAIAADNSDFSSYLLRSELRVQTSAFNHVDELTALLAAAGEDVRAQMLIGYALAKELDDLGRFDAAFHWFSTAARARRSRLAYDVAVDERKMRRIREAFAGPLASGTTATEDASRVSAQEIDSSRFIFIIGLPRSGTTLVERILTGLPGVRSNGETDHFSNALFGAAPGEGGDIFARASLADPREVARRYAELAGNGAAREFIIEKLPMNYLYVGAILRALPAAKILSVRRSPLDSCFAMYRTLFAEAYPFSYDFNDLARYFAAYEDLMRHWRTLAGERLHEVVYERLVADPATEAAAIAQYCGLEWTPAALAIQSNTAVSLTASASQVRRPIYGTSSGRWRHYRAHLGALISALRACGVALPDDA